MRHPSAIAGGLALATLLAGCDVTTSRTNVAATTTSSAASVITSTVVVAPSTTGGTASNSSAPAVATLSGNTIAQQFQVAGQPSIVVANDAGATMLSAAQDGAVSVKAEKHADSPDALSHMQVSMTQEGNTIHVVFQRGSDVTGNEYVNVTITAPADSALQVTTHAGAVTATGFRRGLTAHSDAGELSVDNVMGDLNLRTSAGAIRAMGVNGAVDAETSAGAVTVSGALHGANTVRASSGRIAVSIPAASALSVRASTGAGSISNDFGFPVTGGPAGGTFSGTIGSGSDGSLNLQASTGSVTLQRS
mgnify:CR=1 FL=1